MLFRSRRPSVPASAGAAAFDWKVAAPHFRLDVISGVLFKSGAVALMTLIAFIARKRLGASVGWVGLLGSAVYFGYVWNLFLSRVTARVSVSKSIVVIMIASGVAAIALAFQTNMTAYGLVALVMLTVYGLYDVQYNTLVRDLYKPEHRPRLLSYRYLVISLAGAVVSTAFGRWSASELGRLPVFITAGAMMIAAAFVFRLIRPGGETPMEAFSPVAAVRALIGDRPLGRAAGILAVYGWVGAGTRTLIIVLFTQSELVETQVGLITAMGTIGTLVATWLITPRQRFAGGASNFRLCFTASASSMLIYLAITLSEPGPGAFPALLAASFLFGVSNGGFVLATQTIGINLAPEGKTTLYVNSLMIVQGLRGLAFPLVTAAVLSAVGLTVSFVMTAVVALFCAVTVWLPGVDGTTERSGASA